MKIFISYRRSDARDFAGRLSDRLRQELQITDVFLDIDEIEAGAQFEQRIRDALKRCAVSLVLIGPDWRGGPGADGQPRIFEDRDFVRLEVREALSAKSKVIPVLINGAAMPARENLPADIGDITSLNAVFARHETFARDADAIADAVLARKAPSPLKRYWSRHPFQHGLFRSVLGLVVAWVLLIVGAVAYNAATGLSLNQGLGGTGPAIMLAAGVLGAGIILPLLTGRRRRAS